MKEQTDKQKKTVEVISQIIALCGGGAFIYWILTLTEVI